MPPETILITGASRGIGAAAARRMARPGRRLLLLARSEIDLRRVARDVEDSGAEARVVPVDLADLDAAGQALERLLEEPGGVDGMILNAGVANHLRFEETDRALIKREMNLNFHSPIELLARVLPSMRTRRAGRVVVVGSLTSMVPFPGNASYSASKAALLALVRSLRLELKDEGIFLGAVLPGYTETEMTENHRSPVPPMSAEAVARSIERCYEHRRKLVVPGLVNGLASRVFGAFPEASGSVLARMSWLLPERRT